MTTFGTDAAHFQDREKKFRILTWENVVQTVVYAVVVTGAFWNVKADVRDTRTTVEFHERRIQALEVSGNADHDLLLEIKGDVKAMREKLDRVR